MSTQIAIRLPDSMVTELDVLISQGQASSRASIVEAALRRELRRYQYAQEIDLLAKAVPNASLDALVDWVNFNREPID